MDISSISVATAATMARSSAAYAPEAAARISRGLSVAAIVNDDSGKYSQAEKTEAFSRLHTSFVTGELKGMSEEDQKLFSDTMGHSETARRAQALQRDMVAAMRSSENSSRSGLAFIDSLSPEDQALLGLSLNTPDETGKKPFANLEEVRVAWLAQAELFDYSQTAKKDATGGLVADGPNADRLQPLLDQWRSGRIDMAWAKAVVMLFQPPTDRVDLSAEAKNRLGNSLNEQSAQATWSKAQGSVLDLSA